MIKCWNMLTMLLILLFVAVEASPNADLARSNAADSHVSSVDVECVMCEWIAKEIERHLPKNATEEEITDFVYKVCDLLPYRVSRECHWDIEEHGVAIIDMLVNKTKPSEICRKLKLCPQTNDNTLKKEG